jgi:YtkA-like protein
VPEEDYVMMKRKMLASILLVALAAAAGCSKGYESKKTVEGVTISLKADRYPLVKADNGLSVTVADASGKSVTDAAVQAKYYMPPMPGMAPMEYSVQAVQKGDTYAFTANIPMEGGWKVEVTATRPGKPAAVATFNVDAR